MESSTPRLRDPYALSSSIPMSSIEDRQRPGRLTDDVERLPEPDDKPDPHAQWDEVHGRWTIWDEDQDSWVPILDELLGFEEE